MCSFQLKKHNLPRQCQDSLIRTITTYCTENSKSLQQPSIYILFSVKIQSSILARVLMFDVFRPIYHNQANQWLSLQIKRLLAVHTYIYIHSSLFLCKQKHRLWYPVGAYVQRLVSGTASVSVSVHSMGDRYDRHACLSPDITVRL